MTSRARGGEPAPPLAPSASLRSVATSVACVLHHRQDMTKPAIPCRPQRVDPVRVRFLDGMHELPLPFLVELRPSGEIAPDSLE